MGNPDSSRVDTARRSAPRKQANVDFLYTRRLARPFTDGLQPSWTESAQQLALDGLEIGKVYEISFEQAISRSTWSQTGGYWRITFGSETHDSALMDIPDFGVFAGWDWQTMFFTATATSQSLTVSAMSDTNGLRTDLGIDSFYLGNPGENPDNPDNPPVYVPEPASLALLGIGVIGLAAMRRRKAQA